MLLRQRFDPADADTDYFVDGDTTATDGDELVLEETATPDGLAHQLVIDGSDDISSVIFTITGTDADDNVITDTVTGVTTTEVESVKYFKTVTSIIADDDFSPATVDVGFVDEFVSPSIPLNWRRNVPSRWFGDQTGTMNWSVEFAIEDYITPGDQSAVKWVAVSSSLESESADSSAFVEIGPGYTAARLKVNSYTNTAEITLRAVQPEIV